jgi:beta-ketodecanoyl-[acyl-carrier-protein] synthase
LANAMITGSGLWTPDHGITNAELVESLTEAVQAWNAQHAEEIERGDLEERDLPSERFIVKASGVQHRYVIEKTGVLDPLRLRPHLPTRGEDEDATPVKWMPSLSAAQIYSEPIRLWRLKCRMPWVRVAGPTI